MAEFQMKCPNCGSLLAVDETWVGSTVKCPNCQADVVVTQNNQNTVAAVPDFQNPAAAVQNKDTASLVLGILGLVFCFACFGWILSLIGLIIGCKKQYKTGIILGGVGLGINIVGTLLLMGAMLLPALNSARGRARQTQCINNLKQIGLGIHMYSMDYHEELPPAQGENGLGLLNDYLYYGGKIFKCPSNDGSRTSYYYLGTGKLKSYSTPANAPIVVELPEHHNGLVNVLFLDGHVESIHVPSYITSVREIVEHVMKDRHVSQEDRARLLRSAERYE